MSNGRIYPSPSPASSKKAERRVTFFSPSLGIKLHRDPKDGFVRVLDVMHDVDGAGLPIQRQGSITAGDILCEVQGIANLRNLPLTPKGWGQVVAHLRAAPRPLVFYVMAENQKAQTKSDDFFDPFALGDLNMSCHTNTIQRHNWPTVSKDSHSSLTPAIDNGRRQSRSLTPPKGLFFGRQPSGRADGSTRNDKSSSNGGTKSMSHYLHMGTACLIPNEFRLNSPNQVEAEHSFHNGFLGGGGNDLDVQIQCQDMQQMHMVSQISMDEELLALRQEEEDDLAQRYEYNEPFSSIRYREEQKNDDPRLRGPQPKRPPRYNPAAVPKRRGTTRRLSF